MRTPYISVNQATKEIFLLPGETNEFFTTLGIQGDDVIVAIDDTAYNLDNIYDMIMASQGWKEGHEISVKIKRAGKNNS
jgi:type II secretory pathway component PulC